LPAVQLARLKTEIAALSDLFASPDDFKRSLDHLLEFYADRVYRAGHNVQFRPLTPTRHVSRLVIQQLELALRPLCTANAPAALALSDALWPDPYIETRHLAVFILGQVTLDPPQPVLKRLMEWAKPAVPTEILKELFSAGTLRLRTEIPALWLETIQSWLDTADQETQDLGLKALLPVIEERQFNNLPPIFRMISPFMHSSQTAMLPELQDLLYTLIQRSPTESLYFLRQMLGSPTPPGVMRVIRRGISQFSPESQASLRKMMLVNSS